MILYLSEMSAFLECVLFAGLLFAFSNSATSPSTHVDPITYHEGKKQYELIQYQAELPQYGQCWKDAMAFTHTGCQRLTDDIQGRLALAYLNCFLHLQGRHRYDCQPQISLEECTKTMEDADRSSFTTFFTHTQNICYFLRAQVWNEATENTISMLTETSSQVATQLQKSSQLQAEMLRQQNDSLGNQKILMENAVNLTSVLSTSSDEINRLFHTFKETTQEQRLLMTGLFDQLTSLKQTVLGEFSGFYSLLYYFFSVLVCYLLTSTTRTSGARFWLFGVMTASVFCEYLITAWWSSFLLWTAVPLENHDDWLYWLRSYCRKIFAALGFLVLLWFAYSYRDINAVNNQLLMEIRKQNSDLKRLFHGIQSLPPEKRPNGVAEEIGPGASNDAADSSSTSSTSETVSMDSESDRTYILPTAQGSDTDSCLTADTLQGGSQPSTSSGRQTSLRAELRDLLSATPLKEMSGQMEQWVSTGLYSQPQRDTNGTLPSAAKTGAEVNSGSPYALRPRRPSPWSAPAAEVESARSFARTVRRLERVAQKNSRLACAAVTAKRCK